MSTSSPERGLEFNDRFEALVADFPDIFARDVELAVPVAWLVVTVVDDAADPEVGFAAIRVKANQWRHTSVGLCEVAKDNYLAGWMRPDESEGDR